MTKEESGEIRAQEDMGQPGAVEGHAIGNGPQDKCVQDVGTGEEISQRNNVLTPAQGVQW